MTKIPKAITNGEKASFIMDRVIGAFGPSDFLIAEYIFVVRKTSKPIARNVYFVLFVDVVCIDCHRL